MTVKAQATTNPRVWAAFCVCTDGDVLTEGKALHLSSFDAEPQHESEPLRVSTDLTKNSCRAEGL